MISRTSAFSFKGENLDVREIAKQLNVAHVLEGSVRKAGDTVRITAQLVEARSDTHLWSQTYDRTLDDIFAVQDEIAAAVVEQLKLELLGAVPHASTTDPEAYTMYLRARDMLRQPGFDPEPYHQIVDLLKQVVERDAEFVPAWTGLAKAYFRLRGTEGTSAAEGERLAFQAVQRALVIDPDDATANAYQAFRSSYEGDFATAAKRYERAFAEDPANEEVLRTLVVFLRAIGRSHLAASVGEYGVRRNPLCAGCLYVLGHAYLFAGRLDEAEYSFRRMALLFGGTKHSIGMTLLLKGQPQLALEAFDELEPDAHQYQGRALALHDLGRHAESQQALSRLLEFTLGDLAVDTNATLVAEAYAWLGETDAAFAELARQFEPRADGSMPKPALFIANQLQEPVYRNLHADPRWEELLQKYGISQSQLAAIQLELQIPDG